MSQKQLHPQKISFDSEESLVFPEEWESIPKDEKETTVVVEYSSDLGTIYTNEPRIVNKMKKLCATVPQNYKLTEICTRDGKTSGIVVTFKKKLLSFRTGATSEKQISEDQEEEADE